VSRELIGVKRDPQPPLAVLNLSDFKYKYKFTFKEKIDFLDRQTKIFRNFQTLFDKK